MLIHIFLNFKNLHEHVFKIPTDMPVPEPAGELRDATLENDDEFQHKGLRFSP